MSIFFVNTQDAQISNAFLATLGAAPGSTYLAQVKTFGLVPSVQAMINATGSSTAAALSTKVATNLGLTGAALTGGTAYLSSVTFAGSSSAWAANLMETLNLFSTLQSDATYGSAATAYLARVNSAVSYSSVATNNSTDLSTLAAAVGSAGSTGAGSTFTLTANTETVTMTGPGQVNGVINFGGGTAPAAGTTLDALDTITGTSAPTGDILRVVLQNAGAAIGGAVTAASQVNTVDLQAPVAHVQQANSFVFGAGGAGSKTQTFNYGGANGSFTSSTTAATQATNFTAAVNAAAGGTVATVGKVLADSDLAATTASGNAVLVFTAATSGLVVGMTLSGVSVATGATIKSISTDLKTVTMSLVSTGAITTTSGDITAGGGTTGVTILAPTPGTAAPSVAFGADADVDTAKSSIPSQVLTVANTNGTVGDTVNFTFGGVSSSYVVQATEANTATALAAAINNITGGANGSALAAVATNDVTITANVAGTALPSIVFAGKSGTLPTVAFTTANKASVGEISFGKNSNMDSLLINNISGQASTIAAASAPGASIYTSDLSSSAVTFSGLSAAQLASKNGGSGNLTVGFGTTVTAGTVNISGGSTAGNLAVTGAALTAATINSTGAANTIGTLTGAASTTSTTINASTALTTGAATNLGATVTVNGAGNVSFGTDALASGVTTLNAAGLSGNLTVVLGDAVTQTVTGGTGADVISSGAVLTTGSVNAGAGTDTLVLTNAAHLASATLAAKYTNFEILRINTGISQDMANAPASITAVQTMGVATVSNMTPAQAASVQMRTNAVAGTADNMAFSLANAAGTADILNIVAGTGLTTTGALDIGTLNVTGFETLTLRANAGPLATAGDVGAGDRTTNITGTITGANLKTITLTGTAVDISNLAITNATAGVTIDGSALTGDGLAAASQAGLTVGGNAFVGSTIIGSGVRDVFTIGAEGSVYNGGAGNDRMITTVAVLVADGVDDGSMNGGLGTDTLVISDTTTTLTDNHFTKLSNFEALTLSNTVGDASITTGAAFNSAFATGATIVTGKLAATKDITFQGGLSTVGITLTVDADLITGAATDVQTIVTGQGADTVTFAGDNTYVGVAGANDQGTIFISTGDGNDTISFTHGQLLANTRLGVTSAAHQAVIIQGGKGADTIVKGTGSLNSTTVSSVTYFNMAAGDSGTTLATADKITGFQFAGVATDTLSDVLNFEGSAKVTSFSNSIDFGSILTHSVTGSMVTFDTAATFASAKTINASNLADVVGYLNANMGVNETAGFLFDTNGDGANDSTIVFHQGSSLTNVADDMVLLVGTIGLSLNATLTTVTAGAIAIA